MDFEFNSFFFYFDCQVQLAFFFFELKYDEK